MVNEYSCCLGVPHYNHLAQFQNFLPQLLATHLPMVVVDDGSAQAQHQAIEALLAPHKQVQLITHEQNRGKGAAIESAARAARAMGHTHLLQIDADGQHDASRVARFVEESQQHPQALISGAPIFAADAPKARTRGRKITDFFVAIETLSLGVKDSLCGFRVYPLAELEKVYARYGVATGMGVDTDLIVKSSWENVELRFLDIEVKYTEDGLSHFRYLRDNLALIALHIRLLSGALLRLPKLLARPDRAQ